jgi:hypothetical protein
MVGGPLYVIFPNINLAAVEVMFYKINGCQDSWLVVGTMLFASRIGPIKMIILLL